MKIKLFSLLLILLCGCADEVMLHPMLHELQAEVTVETTLPDEVLSAMKKEADRMAALVERRLTYEGENEIKQYIIERGLADVDFHAQQKAFYTRYIDAGGIAIVGPDDVPDLYFLDARNAILVMTAKHPELRNRLLSKHESFYMVLVADQEDIADMPERQLHIRMLNFDPSDDILNASCRTNFELDTPAVNGNCYAPVINPLYPSLTFVHEFAHRLEWEMERLKPGFQGRLMEAYEESGAKARVSAQVGYEFPFFEYWAELVETWFYRIGPESTYPTYEAFFEQHPLFGEMLDEWFPRLSLARRAEDIADWEWDWYNNIQ